MNLLTQAFNQPRLTSSSWSFAASLSFLRWASSNFSSLVVLKSWKREQKQKRSLATEVRDMKKALLATVTDLGPPFLPRALLGLLLKLRREGHGW